MGLYISIRTKDKIKLDTESKARNSFFDVVGRGFASFHQNANNNSKRVIDSLAESIGMNLDFLVEPEFYSEKESGYFAFNPPVTEEDFKIYNSEPTGFAEIKPFLEKLEKLQLKFIENPDYESQMDYDREWWQSYFGTDFQKDIKSLSEFLRKLESHDAKEFSFDFG